MPENVQIKHRGGDPDQACEGNNVPLLGYPIPAWMKGPGGRVNAYYDKRTGILRMVGSKGAATMRFEPWDKACADPSLDRCRTYLLSGGRFYRCDYCGALYRNRGLC